MKGIYLDKIREEFAKRLKDLRLKHGKSQEQIRRHLDISLRQYQRYENGEADPSINILIRLTSYFDVSLNDLLGVGDDNNNLKVTILQHLQETNYHVNQAIKFIQKMET
jgi:transcriptional regulator with XRE-family HTH domain